MFVVCFPKLHIMYSRLTRRLSKTYHSFPMWMWKPCQEINCHSLRLEQYKTNTDSVNCTDYTGLVIPSPHATNRTLKFMFDLVQIICIFLLQNGALWDISLMHRGICEMVLLHSQWPRHTELRLTVVPSDSWLTTLPGFLNLVAMGPCLRTNKLKPNN